MAILSERLAEIKRAEAIKTELEPDTNDPVVIGFDDLLAREFPPRENLLAPWLPMQGLTMIHAYRGIGKTQVALGIAYAVSSGTGILRWRAPAPRGVLLIDGEMPAVVLQERLAAIIKGSDVAPSAPFLILTPDLQKNGMLNLSNDDDQQSIEKYLDGIHLIIIDNISTLCRSGRENESESWQPIQAWALKQRAAGRSVLFVHHSGKGGHQRGTSRREDVLDTVITLRRPPDYDAKSGALFEVHFEKARGIHGDDVAPFEAQLIEDATGARSWTTRSIEDSNLDRVVRLLTDGLTQSEVATELNLSKGYVSKLAAEARKNGRVS